MQGVATEAAGPGDETEIAGGLLHAIDDRVFGQDLIGIGLNADPRPAGYVIEDHGDLHPICHISKMLDQALLGGLVVVRRNHQDGVGANRPGVFRFSEGREGVVPAHAHDHLHFALAGVHRIAHQLIVLVLTQRGVFAGGAANHDGSGPAGQLKVQLLLQLIVVYALLAKGRHNGGTGALKYRDFVHACLLKWISPKSMLPGRRLCH